MAVTLEDLRDYVRNLDDDDLAEACLTAAVSLLGSEYRIDVAATDAPELLDMATLEVSARLWEMHNAPGGYLTGFSVDGGPLARLSRDPMTSVRAFMRPWRKLAMA